MLAIFSLKINCLDFKLFNISDSLHALFKVSTGANGENTVLLITV